MRELLPDSWHAEELKDTCCRAPRPRRGGLITDVVLWCECYATMVAVLSTKYPEKAPHFMDYMRSIVRASRTFEGAAWASYDAAFRRRAANRLSPDWSQSDSALFNEAFAGRGKVLHRCIHCLSEMHTSRECFYAPQEEPPHPKQPRPGLGHPSFTNHPSWPTSDRSMPSMELCGLFNRMAGNQCTFRKCRFAHICSRCRIAPHPASECPQNRARRSFRGRSPSPRRGAGLGPAKL